MSTINEAGRLGASIKKFRTEKNMSLRQLAEASGVSISQISKIETGKGDTTVGNLIKIAKVLDVPASKIINETEGPHVLRPLRKGEGFSIGRQVAKDPRFREIFLNIRRDAVMQPEVMFIPPGATSGRPLTHDGEEFFYVLKGRVRFAVAERTFEMEEGDSFYFNCTIPHMWCNLDEEAWCELLICFSPPSLQ